MSLRVHRATRADALADALGRLLAEPLDDPFAAELVVVPAKGVERWLSQRLSHLLGPTPGSDDGVCAGVEFASPQRFLRRVRGDDDPWSAARLTWPVLGVIDASAGEAWCATLSHHLGYDASDDDAVFRAGRRLATARRLARLFASYAVQRPGLLEAWEAGVDDVPADLAWQPELWRRVVAAVGRSSPAQGHRAVVAAVAAGARLDLPDRVSFFGPTRLAVTEIELLEALAVDRDVHLWLTHPSPGLWDALVPRLAGAPTAVARAHDASYDAARHPLLATLGRDVRELQRSLSAGGFTSADVKPPGMTGNYRLPEENWAAPTLLAQLQADIGANGQPTRTPTDRSLSVHACHGRARQVEVLREVIVGLLADDETLEPRDIVVMCPDIEAYAPLVEAAFGLGDAVPDGHPGHHIRVRLADRGLVQTNPLVAVLEQVLEIAAGRAEASRVLDLLATPPVRHRFRFTDGDLEQIAQWVEASGVRWSFDAAHRQTFGLAAIPQNTWQFGLDRVLAGVALSDDSGTYLGATLPLDDVASKTIDLAGRLREALARLEAVCDDLSGEHPVEHWRRALSGGISSLAAVPKGEEWQFSQLQSELIGLLSGAEDAGQDQTALRLPDIRSLLEQQLAGRPTRANFRTGGLTVCTMTPMRSVPHRVVCLLGIDDGVFPRGAIADGDNVLAVAPLTGERDARSEDRQLLLDAIMAAGDNLVITYSGHNEVSGAKRPPAVPLGELIDVVSAMAPDFEVQHHRLQAFDAATLTSPQTPSFDRLALAGARALLGVREEPARLADLRLPPATLEDIDLEALTRFFRNPVREFLKGRLGIGLPVDADEMRDAIPLEVNALAEYAVGDRMLRDLLAGRTPDDVLNREWRRGSLPPGNLGWQRAQAILHKAGPVADSAEAAIAGEAASAYDLDLPLAGRRLRGTVIDLYGTRVIKAGFQKLGPSRLLEAWLSLLALEASDPGRGWTAGAIGRASREPVAREAYFAPADAPALLTDLIAIYDAGMRGPLPLPLKTAHAWAKGRLRNPEVARRDALRYWKSDKFPGEQADASFVRAWGAACSLESLMAAPPLVGEAVGPGAGEPSRLGAMAARVWHPVFAARSRGAA